MGRREQYGQCWRQRFLLLLFRLAGTDVLVLLSVQVGAAGLSCNAAGTTVTTTTPVQAIYDAATTPPQDHKKKKQTAMVKYSRGYQPSQDSLSAYLPLS